MDQLIRRHGRRLALAVTTLPTRSGWLMSALVGLATLAILGALGFSTGLYALHPANTGGVALRLAETLVAPAFCEEAVFRGLLIPSRAEGSRFIVAAAVSLPIFVAWHVAEATTFLTAAAPMFLRWDFLACAAILGLGCAIARWRTGSLWPAVALHWVMVTIWQTWLGGFTA